MLVSFLATITLMRYLLEGRINVFNIAAYSTILAYIFPLGWTLVSDQAAIEDDVADYLFYGFEILLMAFPLLVMGLNARHEFSLVDYVSQDLKKKSLVQICVLASCLALLEIALLQTELWTYGSLSVADTEKPSPIVLLAGQITVGLAGLSEIRSRLYLKGLSEDWYNSTLCGLTVPCSSWPSRNLVVAGGPALLGRTDVNCGRYLYWSAQPIEFLATDDAHALRLVRNTCSRGFYSRSKSSSP